MRVEPAGRRMLRLEVRKLSGPPVRSSYRVGRLYQHALDSRRLTPAGVPRRS